MFRFIRKASNCGLARGWPTFDLSSYYCLWHGCFLLCCPVIQVVLTSSFFFLITAKWIFSSPWSFFTTSPLFFFNSGWRWNASRGLDVWDGARSTKLAVTRMRWLSFRRPFPAVSPYSTPRPFTDRSTSQASAPIYEFLKNVWLR